MTDVPPTPESIDAALGQVGRALADAALKSALGPVLASLNGGFESLVKSALSGGKNFPALFARGGTVAAPSYFPSGRALASRGKEGEEALRSRADGPRGRAARSAGGAGGPPNVKTDVSTGGAGAVRRSEAQVAAALARAVARGRRGL